MPHAMTGSELADRLALALSATPAPQVRDAVKKLIDALAESMAGGRRIEIRGFGSFSVHTLPAKQGRNPKTGERINVGQKRKLRFKAGKELGCRVDRPCEVGRRPTPTGGDQEQAASPVE
jgi:integration host factor subunit beta